MIREGMVTITTEKYDELLEKEAWLLTLEAAGVDNWEGYDYARELWAEQHPDE